MSESPFPSLPHPSRKSQKRLDWFIFLVADVQTGFGPFVAVYLTSQKWTQIEIGLVLTVAGLVSLLGQIPGGALVDAVRSERVVAAFAARRAKRAARTGQRLGDGFRGRGVGARVGAPSVEKAV